MDTRTQALAEWTDLHYSEVMTGLQTTRDYWAEQAEQTTGPVQAMARQQVETWQRLMDSLDRAYDTD